MTGEDTPAVTHETLPNGDTVEMHHFKDGRHFAFEEGVKDGTHYNNPLPGGVIVDLAKECCGEDLSRCPAPLD